MTKNTSTPTNPPDAPRTPAWYATTARMATARRPSTSDRCSFPRTRSVMSAVGGHESVALGQRHPGPRAGFDVAIADLVVEPGSLGRGRGRVVGGTGGDEHGGFVLGAVRLQRGDLAVDVLWFDDLGVVWLVGLEQQQGAGTMVG